MGLNGDLRALFDRFWDWRLSRTPEFASFVGVKTYDGELETYTLKRFQEDFERCGSFLEDLEALEKSHEDLGEEDHLNIAWFREELNTFIEGYELKGFLFPLNHMEGVQVDLQRLAGWMTLESVADYENLIKRYGKFPKLAQELCDLMQAAIDQGLTNHLISMDKVVGQLKGHQKPAEQTDFYQPFEDMSKAGIEGAVADDLRAKAIKVIEEAIKPGMKKLEDFVENTYIPKCRPEVGISSLTSGDFGKVFYAGCIKFHTSTDLTADEIHQLGLEEVSKIESIVKKIIVDELGRKEDFKTLLNSLREDPSNYFNSGQELLDRFSDIVENHINPKLLSLFKSAPKIPLKIEATPENMSNGPGAYYISGTPDGKRPGIFYVNSIKFRHQLKNGCISLALHEGNPGHHLQACYLMTTPDEVPKFRTVMEDRSYFMSPSRFPIHTAFLEGWALYCEHLGNELGLLDDPYDRIGQLSCDLMRACRLVVDTGLHSKGWSREEAVQFMLEHCAASEGEIRSEVDRYITWPGQALGYKIGDIKIRQLRAKCESALGDTFDVREFHELVLKSAGPLRTLEAQVDKFIREKKL